MTPSTSAPFGTLRDRLAIGIGLLSFLAYFVAIHLLIVDRTRAPLTLTLVAAPWLFAAASATAKSIPSRPTTRVAAVAAILIVGAALVWRIADRIHDRVDDLVCAEGVLFLLSLAGLFGASLYGRREALVTRLARVARCGDMPASVIRYTRHVTVAWAIFFVAAAAISTLLFVTQSRELWSAFINLALWPLMAIVFSCQYAIRVHVLPGVVHSSPLDGVRTFMRRSDLPTEADPDLAGRRG